jgi:hypothetical protein
LQRNLFISSYITFIPFSFFSMDRLLSPKDMQLLQATMTSEEHLLFFIRSYMTLGAISKMHALGKA